MKPETQLKDLICGIAYDSEREEWSGLTIPDLERKVIDPQHYESVEATYKGYSVYFRKIDVAATLGTVRW